MTVKDLPTKVYQDTKHSLQHCLQFQKIRNHLKSITMGWLMQCWYIHMVTKDEEGLHCVDGEGAKDRGVRKVV